MDQTGYLIDLRKRGRKMRRLEQSENALREATLVHAEAGREAGLTVREMADALGVAESTLGVALWERQHGPRRRRPSGGQAATAGQVVG